MYRNVKIEMKSNLVWNSMQFITTMYRSDELRKKFATRMKGYIWNKVCKDKYNNRLTYGDADFHTEYTGIISIGSDLLEMVMEEIHML